jgi:hypothetical protein
MTTETAFPARARAARTPFYFNSAADLTRIGRERAGNLSELLAGLQQCPEASIFHHTFQTLRKHHYIRGGFSNDFAQWVFAACNEVGLAERLAALDIRDFTSLPAMRETIVRAVASYLATNPAAGTRPAFEPFYFCASETVVIPTTLVAHDLEEFAACLERVSAHSIHHHFISARLRLRLTSNDFSVWLDEELGLPAAAARLNRIDIYTATLYDVRQRILQIVLKEMGETPA